jgi:acetylornithine deacetylase/succinyl-diaminopimelate desuccinylase-like protein
MFMHIKSLEFLSTTNQSPCNLKFLFEGEEEIGSPSLEKYLMENADKLKADIVLVSDTALINNETPSLIYGLKGITYFDVELTGASKDLHSGIHGGTVENPLHVLCTMISKLHDENKQIIIPGFYDDIIEPSLLEKELVNQIPFDLEQFKSEVGVKIVTGEKGYSTLERISFRPTLDVNGIWGGHNGPGAKTVIASKAFAKISMRLVNGQSIEKVISSFETYFKSLAPETVEVKLTVLASCESALTPIDSIAYKAAESAMFDTFGKKPLPVRMGGSIPVISLFEKVLGINSVLMGFGLDSDNIHGPNEHYGVWNFCKGIETIPLFYKYFSLGVGC